MESFILIWLLVGIANYVWFFISEREFIKNDFNNDFWVTLAVASIMLVIVCVCGPISNMVWVYKWVFEDSLEDF